MAPIRVPAGRVPIARSRDSLGAFFLASNFAAAESVTRVDTPTQTVFTLVDGRSAFGETGAISKAGVAFKQAGASKFTVQPWAAIQVVRTAKADYFPEPRTFAFNRVDAAADASGLLPRIIGSVAATMTLQDSKTVVGKVLVLLPDEVGFEAQGETFGKHYPAKLVESVNLGDDLVYKLNPITGRLEKVEKKPKETSTTIEPPIIDEPPPPVKPPPKSDPPTKTKQTPPGKTPATPTTSAQTPTPSAPINFGGLGWLCTLFPVSVVLFFLKWTVRAVLYVMCGVIMLGAIGAVLGGIFGGMSGVGVGTALGVVVGVLGGLVVAKDDLKESLGLKNPPRYEDRN